MEEPLLPGSGREQPPTIYVALVARDAIPLVTCYGGDRHVRKTAVPIANACLENLDRAHVLGHQSGTVDGGFSVYSTTQALPSGARLTALVLRPTGWPIETGIAAADAIVTQLRQDVEVQRIEDVLQLGLTWWSSSLSQLVAYWSEPAQAMGKVGRVQDAIAARKRDALELVDKALDRGEAINRVVDKTDALAVSARTYERKAKEIKHKMWWRNAKVWAGVILSGLGAAATAFGFLCHGMKCL